MAPSGPPPSKGAAKAKPEAKAKAKAKVKKEDKEEDEGPKMDAPDKAAFEAELEKIQGVIDGLQAQQVQLTSKIGERSGGKDEYFAQRNGFRAQLDEFKVKIDELMARKEGLNKGISDKKQEGMDMRNQLKKMKGAIGYHSEAAIDDRIAEIELCMRMDSFTLKQEKDYLKEISELKRNRPKVGQVNKMEDSLASRDTGSNLRENIGTINEEMAVYRDGKRLVSAALSKLNEERKEQLGDLPACIEERDEIGKKIKEQIEKRNTSRDEFRVKEREYNTWRNEQRNKWQDKAREERQKGQKEWEMTQRIKKAEAMDNQPFVAETTLIEQTIFFCKSLIQDKAPVEEKVVKETKHEFDGEVLMSKDSRAEEFYYAPTANKKKGKSKNKGGKEGGSSKPIKHNAETFKLFDQLKLSAPITTADIPDLLEKLDAQLESYKEKVSVWERDRDELKRKILAGEAVEEKKAEKAEEAEEKEEKAEEQKGEEKDDAKEEAAEEA